MSDSIDLGRLMQTCREHVQSVIDNETKAKFMEKAFGTLIFKTDLSDREVRWVVENDRSYLIDEMDKASSRNELFQYFKQAVNNDVQPRLREARLWKEDGRDSERKDSPRPVNDLGEEDPEDTEPAGDPEQTRDVDDLIAQFMGDEEASEDTSEGSGDSGGFATIGG